MKYKFSMSSINSKDISSEPGLSTNQSIDQVKLFKEGYLISSFSNKDALNNLLIFLDKEIKSFNNGNRENWKQTFGGAFDFVKDDLFIDFVKKNKLNEIVNDVTNQDYVLADAKLRMWTPGGGYLNWHRDTYIQKNGKVIGKIPPDINLFYYPKLDYKSSAQLNIIEKSHRIDFHSQIMNYFQIILGKKKTIFNNNELFILFNSAMLHGLPRYGMFLPTRLQRKINEIIKRKAYPRLILRFCARKNISIYNRGTDLEKNQLPSLN